MGTVRIQSSQSSPATTFYLEADHIGTDAPNRRWLVRFYLRASNGPGGSTGSRYNGQGYQVGRYAGNEFGRHQGSPFLPPGYPNGATRWHDGPWDVWVTGSGMAWDMPLTMTLQYGSINTTLGGSIYLPQIATVPPAPSPLVTTPDQTTATSMRYQFSGNGDGGSGIIRWEVMYGTDPTFAPGTYSIIPSSGTSILTGLTPTTTYYMVSRGVNSVGNGPWSSPRDGTTLAATAPGMLVLPSLDGKSATVTLTPPPEMPSPTGYRLEYRLVGGSTTALDVGSSTTISPLTPGATYQWRAAAVSGTYTGPFSAWTSVEQPNTNTNPGDYFDGSTAARTEVSYAWNGATNNSTSRAVGKAVLGWGAFASGNGASGGSGAVYRVTGGRSQQFAARVDFWTPTTAAGFHAGTGYAVGQTFEALQGATYNALAHVQIQNRSQRLAAMIVWLDVSRTEIARAVGESVNVTASVTNWTALSAVGTPPVGAVAGAIRVIDVEGIGWSEWRSGDSLLIDDVITPFTDYYFDGNTPDTVEWLYQWEGAPNASKSTGIRNPEPIPSPLIDPDCPPVPAPPRPPEISDSCVEDDVLQWRRFWQEIPELYTTSWVDTVSILKVQTSAEVRLVRVRYYPNPFGRTLENLDQDSFCAEQVISYIPGGAIFTLDGVSRRAFLEMEGSSTQYNADSLLHSDSNLWPLLGCGISYYVTVDVPTDTPTNALDLSYTLVQRY